MVQFPLKENHFITELRRNKIKEIKYEMVKLFNERFSLNIMLVGGKVIYLAIWQVVKVSEIYKKDKNNQHEVIKTAV